MAKKSGFLKVKYISHTASFGGVGWWINQPRKQDKKRAG